MVVVVLGKSILVILFTKGPMETGMFLVVRRKSKGVFGVLRIFRNDFGTCDKGGCSFVAVVHLQCSELVGVLRLFIFALCVLWIIEIEGKVPFKFENGVRKVLVPSWFCGVA